MPVFLKIIMISGAFSTALIAGLFYSYSCSVNIGLGRLTNEAYLRAMQQINKAILNAWFFASFMGTLLLLPVCSWILYDQQGLSTGFYMILTATLVYAIGVFGVTIFGNVPLNEALDRFDIGSASSTELKERRGDFEQPWKRLHFIRTIAVLMSLLLTLTALATCL